MIPLLNEAPIDGWSSFGNSARYNLRGSEINEATPGGMATFYFRDWV